MLPWVALGVGTAASLAANVAVGGHDMIGRALAGWPAVALLVSIKLLLSMFDHGGYDRLAVRDNQRPSVPGAAVPGTVRGTGPDDQVSAGTVPAQRTRVDLCRVTPWPSGCVTTTGTPSPTFAHRSY